MKPTPKQVNQLLQKINAELRIAGIITCLDYIESNDFPSVQLWSSDESLDGIDIYIDNDGDIVLKPITDGDVYVDTEGNSLDRYIYFYDDEISELVDYVLTNKYNFHIRYRN